MNPNYEKRLDALESRILPIERVTISICALMPDRAVQPEPIRARGDGWALDRELGESQDDFLNRAEELAQARTDSNVALMVVEC